MHRLATNGDLLVEHLRCFDRPKRFSGVMKGTRNVKKYTLSDTIDCSEFKRIVSLTENVCCPSVRLVVCLSRYINCTRRLSSPCNAGRHGLPQAWVWGHLTQLEEAKIGILCFIRTIYTYSDSKGYRDVQPMGRDIHQFIIGKSRGEELNKRDKNISSLLSIQFYPRVWNLPACFASSLI